jgi:hypothetical protein
LRSLVLLLIIGYLALSSLCSRLGRFLGGTGRLGRTTTSLGRLSLSIGILLSSSLSTRSSLGLGVGLGSRLSSLSGLISCGYLGAGSSLSLDGLLFLLIAILIGLLVGIVGGLLVLGARSLLYLLSRLGIFIIVAGSGILLGLILGLLGGLRLGVLSLVISCLQACQFKTQQIMKNSCMTNSLLSGSLLL